MTLSNDFNYQDKLALDKAKLIARTRINDLGSYEITLNYNSITSVMREDSVEWLEANRLELINPTFSFKTYEGTWNCVDISYNEDSAIIQQRFKVNVGVGDLGDVSKEPDYSAQSGDLSRISDGAEVQKSYYWRVTNPEVIEAPTTAIDGEIWTKTANDNGDGTYDVIVAKEVLKDQTASSYYEADSFSQQTDVNTVTDQGSQPTPSTGQVIRVENTPLENGKFRVVETTRTNNNQTATNKVQAGASSTNDNPGGYRETVEVNTSNSAQDFSSNGGSIPDADVGQIKRIDNVPLEDGTYRTRVTTRTAIPQRIPPESENPGPDYPWIEYGSDYLTEGNSLIIGRNQTWAQFKTDRDRTQVAPAVFKINSISVRVNDYGLYDYTIIANTPG